MGSFLGPAPLQLTDPTSLLELSGLVRGAIAFGVVLALAAFLLWQFEGFVDRSLDRSMARPLRSLGYGIAAHATLAFAGVYVTSQLARIEFFGLSVGALGVVV